MALDPFSELATESADKQSNGWNEERSTSQLYKDDDDSSNSQNCGTRALLCSLHFLNALDGCLALMLIIYGGLTSGGSGKSLSVFCLTFGLLLLTSVVLSEGSIRYSECKRCGLISGGWLGLGMSATFFILSFLLVLASDPISNYLTRHQRDLYLNPSKIQHLQKSEPFLFIFGMAMTTLEVLRHRILKGLRTRLRAGDQASPLTRELRQSLLEADMDRRSESSSEFFPVNESSLISDPLWWSRSKPIETIDNQDWANDSI